MEDPNVAAQPESWRRALADHDQRETSRDPDMADGMRMAYELRRLLTRRDAIVSGFDRTLEELHHWRDVETAPLTERIDAVTEYLKGWHQAMLKLGLAGKTQRLPGGITTNIRKARRRAVVTDSEAFVAWALEHGADPRVADLIRTVGEPVTLPALNGINAALHGILVDKDSTVLLDGEPVPGLAVVGGDDVADVQHADTAWLADQSKLDDETFRQLREGDWPVAEADPDA